MKEELMAESASLITALFADHESATRAYVSVAARGYRPADLRLLMTAETRERLLAAAVRRSDGVAIDALVTALVGARIPGDRARLYDEGIGAGGIVIGLMTTTPQEAEHVERAWSAAGGRDIVCPLLRQKDAA
jgi:hypothetical protein